MAALKLLRMTCWPLGGLLAAILILVGVGHAAPPPISPDEQADIDQAITHGVAYLKRTQQPLGTWATRNVHMIGYAALPGLALLESGVPARDPAVRRAAAFVRSMAPQNQGTYELALSILFLDRLGEARDKELIQTLALRLIVGQGATGGWTYRCPILPGNFHRDILTILRRLDPPQEPEDKKDDRPLEPDTAPRPREPRQGLKAGPAQPREGLKAGPAQPREGPPLENAPTGRPSTGKPAGTVPLLEDPLRPERTGDRKPAVDRPAAPAAPKAAPGQRPQPPPVGPVVIPAHLRAMPIFQDLVAPTSQKSRMAARPAVSDNSNTQFALLGLWVAQRHGVPMKRTLQLLVQRFQNSQNEDGTWGYHSAENQLSEGKPAMTCVGLMALAVGQGMASADGADRKAAAPLDPRIPPGFVALRQSLEPLPLSNLYFLWSLERVAVLYRLPAIGNKDWYRYGVAILLPAQQRDGSWINGGYHGSSPPIDTCLALLFLKRANFLDDLAKKLRLDRDKLTTFITDRQTPSKSRSFPAGLQGVLP